VKTWLSGYFLLAVIALVCLPLSAHHGGASMQTNDTEFKNVTVTHFAWANPHCLVEFDVKGTDGKIVNWTAETSAPQALRLTGWEKNSLKPGDIITIFVKTAKSGQPAGRLTKILLANGTTLGDAGEGAGGVAR